MFYKLMIALLVIGGLAPFTFLKGKDGEPLMKFSDISLPSTKIPDLNLPDLSEGSSSESTNVEGTVYKWKDENGVWHFTSEPPPKGQEFSATVYDPNMNVIQSVETKRSIEKEAIAPNQPNGVTTSPSLSDAYSPEKIEKLFDDANNLETLLNDRMKEQNKILDNL